jgi:hypothetical protein
MSWILSWCRVLKGNPDNVATPVEAWLGDVTRLSHLAWNDDLFYWNMEADLFTTPVLTGTQTR